MRRNHEKAVWGLILGAVVSGAGLTCLFTKLRELYSDICLDSANFLNMS